MNKSILRNAIIRNIQPSHKVNNIEFDQADLLVKRNDQAKEDLIKIKFKKFSNIYKDGDIIDIVGNIRSYTKKLSNGKNSVQVYVFTYFDKPETEEYTNNVELDGRICSIEPLKTLDNGRQLVHFIIANNIITENTKINSYIPCVAWGEMAQQISQLQIGTKLSIQGELHSREYKKQLVNKDLEIKVAHELYIKKYVITPWVKDEI